MSGSAMTKRVAAPRRHGMDLTNQLSAEDEVKPDRKPRLIWMVEVKRGAEEAFEPSDFYATRQGATQYAMNERDWSERSNAGWKYRITKYIPAPPKAQRQGSEMNL